MAGQAAALRVQVQTTPAGARLIDCGIKPPGGIQAGLALARVCMAGQAEISLVPGDITGFATPHIVVATDHPVAACMASQYAGWQISVGKYFAMGSGPMRALYGKEELFHDIPGREQAPVAVGSLETRKFPGEDVVAHLAQQLQLAPQQLTLLA